MRFDLTGERFGRLLLYGLGLALTFNLGRDITLLVAYPADLRLCRPMGLGVLDGAALRANHASTGRRSCSGTIRAAGNGPEIARDPSFPGSAWERTAGEAPPHTAYSRLSLRESSATFAERKATIASLPGGTGGRGSGKRQAEPAMHAFPGRAWERAATPATGNR